MDSRPNPAAALTRRITGIETEYGITFSAQGQRKLNPDEIARYMFRPVIEKYGATNIFTDNAGRLYLDVGSHPEFATAECDQLSQLIAQDRAGEVLLNDLAATAEQALAGEGISGSVYLFKNNVDSAGNSYGCHENYLVGRDIGLKNLSRQLLPFLVTRQLICGAGVISRPYPNSPFADQPIQFCFAQRADHVWDGVSSATTRSRPIINTRDEPHADSSKYRRLHVIVGDSNMSETTTALKIASTQLVLEMIEADWPLPELTVANEIKSIRAISRDMSGTADIPLRDGSTATALEIQWQFLTAAQQWLAQRPWRLDLTDPGADQAKLEQLVALWQRTLEAVESGDYSSINRDIDWAIKYSLLQRYMAKGLKIDDAKLAQLDLSYHDTRPGRGIFRVLEAKGLVSRWIDDAAIADAVKLPPQTTRAKLRGDFLRAAREQQQPHVIDWTHLKLSLDPPETVLVNDPFATTDPDVTAVIERMTADG